MMLSTLYYLKNRILRMLGLKYDFFMHIITTEEDEKKVLKRFKNFNKQAIKNHEILKFNLNDVIRYEQKRNELPKHFRKVADIKVRQEFGEDVTDLPSIISRASVLGRKFKIIVYLKCNKVEDITNLNKYTMEHIISNFVAVEKDKCYYLGEKYTIT
ncbi:MAG: hypothetical protein MJA82_18035 [Clostridia bacterium]|nr:hypothetical protein [Clostridia bacterium]